MFVQTKRVELADGSWIDYHEPSFFERKAALVQTGDVGEWDYSRLLLACIEAWSEDVPVTPDNINRLDQATVVAMVQAFFPPEPEVATKN